MQKNSIRNDFLERSFYMGVLLWILKFVASKFLAITTGVLAFGMCDDWMMQLLPEAYWQIGRFVGVGIFYVLIDMGLTHMISWYMEEKKLLKNETDNKKIKARKLLLSIVFYLIIFRFLASLTSSLWAAPEVATQMQGQFDYEFFINKLTAADSLKAAREGVAFSFAEDMEANEKDRIRAKAEEAQMIIQKAVNSGDRYQRASYAREGFAWIENRKNNDQKDHAYAKRIRDAQIKAAQLIPLEKEKTASALDKVNQVQNDTSHAQIVASLTALSNAAKEEYNASLNSKKGLIYLLDFFAGIIMLVCIWVETIRKDAAGEIGKVNRKSVGAIISLWFREFWQNRIEELEQFLDVDIDQNGHVGSVPVATEQRNRTGFLAIQNRRKIERRNNGTEQEQPVPEQPEPLVPQLFQRGTEQLEQVVPIQNRTSGTEQERGFEHTETYIAIDTNESSIRKKFFQAFMRKNLQPNPATPQRNFSKFGQQLQQLGYDYKEKGQGVGATLKLTKGVKTWNKKVTTAKSKRS